MRICEVVFTPSFGGAETLVSELAMGLRHRGHEVEIAALQPVAGSDLRDFPEAMVPTTPAWAKSRKAKRFVAARRLIGRGRYDIIHTHSFFPNLYVRAAAALGSDIPIVTTLHSASDDFSKQVPRTLERMLGMKTAAVVAVSAGLREQYLRYFPAFTARTVLIPNGVRKLPFQRAARDTKPRQFATIGRIARQKDLETVIRGFAAFVSEVEDSRLALHIVGPETEPAYARAVRDLADAVDRTSSIVFHGAVPDPFGQIAVDVLVHGAPREGHPITLLEAAARGIPVICPYGPTVSGTIDHCCTTFTGGDADALGNALVAVYTGWPSAVDLAEKAWLLVPDIADCVAAYEALFLEVAESKVARARR